MGRARKPGLARSELVKEAANKSPVLEKKEADVEKDLVNILEDLTISPTPKKESVQETKLAPSVPEAILDLVVYYEMMSKIPSSVHPSVKDFISSTFLEYVQVDHCSTRKLVQYLPLLSKADVRERLDDISSRAEMSFSSFLSPPVSHCLKVSACSFLRHFVIMVE